MKRKVSAVDARQKLGELLEGVFYRGDEIVIERAGKPMAVLVPTARYEAMKRDRDELFEMIRKVQEYNADTPAEVLEREIQEAIEEVRQDRRARSELEKS